MSRQALGPSHPLFNGYCVTFPVLKRAKREGKKSSPSTAE